MTTPDGCHRCHHLSPGGGDSTEPLLTSTSTHPGARLSPCHHFPAPPPARAAPTLANRPAERPHASTGLPDTPTRPGTRLSVALSGPSDRRHEPRTAHRRATPPPTRKALSVQIRLHDTTSEIAATLAALRQVLAIRNESRPYPDRPPSTLHRVYLDAAPEIDQGACH